MSNAPFLPGRWLQIWELGGSAAAEDSLSAACDTALQFGFQGVMVKALDGLNWHGSWSDHPDAPRSLQHLAGQRHAVEARGLGFGIWTVPLHGDRDFLMRQAGLYASAGAEAGILVLDAEPYDRFWGANRPEGDASYFMDLLRKYAPSLPIVLQPDGRSDRLRELRLEEWLPNTNVYAPQVYWTDFGQAQEDTLHNSQLLLGEPQYTIPDGFAPTFPGDASFYDTAWEISRDEYDAEGVILWRLGTAGPKQLAAIQFLNLAKDLPQPDADAVAKRDAEIAQLKTTLDIMQGDLDAARNALQELRQDVLASCRSLSAIQGSLMHVASR